MIEKTGNWFAEFISDAKKQGMIVHDCDMASLLGVTQKTISVWINHGVPKSREKITRIACSALLEKEKD